MKNKEKVAKERFESFLSDKFTILDAQNYLKDTLKIKIKDGKIITSKIDWINPSITYEKTYDRFVLNYLGPNDVGMQHFYFDGNNFCSCYNEFGNENLDSFFFRFNANSYVRLIFYCFQINATVLHRAYRQNKNLKRKVVLNVKKMAVFWVFDVNRYDYYGKGQKPEKIVELTSENAEEINACLSNMKSAIELAVKNYDLSYFSMYFSNAVEFAKLTKRPVPSKDALFRVFTKSVETSQL